jgi:hypothetical protein
MPISIVTYYVSILIDLTIIELVCKLLNFKKFSAQCAKMLKFQATQFQNKVLGVISFHH